ncbi:MAG: hypothetical protein ACOVNU_13320 [Candidatus Kapaibacteriota bacterium]
MLKKLLFLLMFTMSVNMFAAQDDRLDELPFDEEPLEENTKSYFAIAGGATLSFMFVNFDDMNAFLTNKENPAIPKQLEGPLLMTGGTGFTGVPWVPNLRVGVSGMAGTSTVEYLVETNKKQVDYTVSSFGLNFDYGFVLTKSLALLPGVGVNFGSTTIEYINNGQDLPWGTPNDLTNSYIARMNNDYIMLQPSLNLEWAALDYLAIRFGGGFSYQVNASEWTLNKNDKVTGAPDGLKLSAPYAQIGILVGLFNY